MFASMLVSLALLSNPATAAEWPELAHQIVATGEGRNDAVVLVAIEDYANVDDVLGARANADVIANGVSRASKTMKSLPRPCIFRNGRAVIAAM